MAIRIIGNKVSNPIRIQRSDSKDGVRTPITFQPVVRDELNPNTASNVDGSDGDGPVASVISPESLSDSGGGAGSDSGAGNRRRGRPPGTRNGNAGGRGTRSSTETTKDVVRLLSSTHLMMAKLMKMPQLALTDEESEKIAEATLRVSECYDFGIGTPEQRAWLNLAMVAGGIYIPKVFGGGPRLVKNVTPKVEVPTPMPDFLVNQ